MEIFASINLSLVITLTVAIATFVAVYAVWQTLVVKDPMQGRLKTLQARREQLKSGFVAPNKRQKLVKKIDHVNYMRAILNKLKLLNKTRNKNLTLKLAQAGFRTQDATIIYSFAKALSPIIGLIVTTIVIFGLNLFEDNQNLRYLTGFGMFALGLYAPDLFIKNVTEKRLDAIRKALPDALDLMVICAEAGLTLDAALNRVAREMAKASPELADEFTLTAIELGFLPERRLALTHLGERVDLKAVRSVVATLIQTEKYGTPLSQSLRVLSSEFRNERMMLAEEKAARLPAVMTVPLILFILPTLFIVLLGPAACSVSDNILGRTF